MKRKGRAVSRVETAFLNGSMVPMERVLSWSLVGVVFLLTTLPLIVFSELFFPFITGKAFVFRFLVELGVVLLLLLALVDRKYLPRITPITIFFGVFVVVMLLADLLGVNPVRSLWSNFERMEGWITLIHLFGLFILFERVLSIRNLWVRFMQVSLGVSVLVGIQGILQIAGVLTINQGGARLDANFGNATYLAVYTLFHFFFAVWLLLRSRLWWVQGIYAVIGVLNIVLLYYTATRGALLGLAAGVLIGLLVYTIYTRNIKVAGAIVVLVMLGVLSFGLLSANKDSAFVSQSTTLSRIASISLEEGETRFRIWHIAWQGFLERPFLGWGQGNFNIVFSKYYNPALYAQEPWFDRTHNIIFDWLVAGGVLGLGVYLLLFGSLIVYLFIGSFSIMERSVLAGLLGGYFVNNLFVFDNLTSYVLFVFIAAFIASKVVKEYRLPRLGIPRNVSRSLIIIIGVVVMYGVLVPPLSANLALINALGAPVSLEERRAFFQEALSHNSSAQEVREQMFQFALRALQSDLPDEQKAQILVEAAIELEKQARAMPESARIHSFYGTTLRLLGQFEASYAVLLRARELAPQKQNVLFEAAVSAELAGRHEEALLLYEEAYRLDESFEQARVLFEDAQERLAI